MKSKKIYAYLLAVIAALFFLGSMTAEAEWGWKQVTNIPNGLKDAYFLDVFFLPSNPMLGWTSGYHSNVLRTTDGGKTWLESSTHGDYQLESIIFLNEKVGYCSGPDMSDIKQGPYQGGIFKSTDGGAQWFDVTPRISNEVNSIELWGCYFWDVDNGVVIGGGCNTSQQFWRTTNGGNSWSVDMHDESGSKMSDAIIDPVTQIGYASGSSTIWKTTDAGFHWTEFSYLGHTSADSWDWQEEMTWKNKSFLFPYSEGCTGTTSPSGGLRFSVDGGKTVRDTLIHKAFFGTFLLDTIKGWGAGFDKSVYYTSDAGKSWNLYNCGIPDGVDLDDLWFINDTTGWVVGGGVYEFTVYHPSNPVITANKSGLRCQGDTITLSTTEKYGYYRWSTGETTPSIKITKTGDYSVYVITEFICDSATSKPLSINYYPNSSLDILLSSGNDPCDGDTVQLSVKQKFAKYLWNTGDTTRNITIAKEGNYSVVATDSNGCDASSSRYVVFRPNPVPQIDSTRTLTFCIGDSVILTAPGGYKFYEWFEKPDTAVISNDQAITVARSGTFYVKVQSIYDCVNLSDNYIVKVLDDTNRLRIMVDTIPYPIDTTVYPLLTCRNVKIRNSSLKPFSLTEAFLKQNIPFSIPLSQLPIEMASGEEKELQLCFSPDSLGLARDTLVIVDICGTHELPIFSYGVEGTFNLNSKCDLKIQFVPTGIKGNFSYSFSNPYPNPSSGEVNVAFSGDIPDTETPENIRAQIFNIYGETLLNGAVKAHTNLDRDGIKNVEGTIGFSTGDLPGGVYYLVLSAGGKTVSMNFVKQ